MMLQPQLELFGIMFMAGVACVFLAGNLLLGRLLRRSVPHPEKAEPYECGEPAVGAAWGRFDLRFYAPALVFLIFDVELALLFPWAVVYGEPGAAGPALLDFALFAGLVMVGYVYLWRRGYLDWVRTPPT